MDTYKQKSCDFCCISDEDQASPSSTGNEFDFKDPFLFCPQQTLAFVDGMQADSNWTNYRALILRDVDLGIAYAQLRALPQLPNVRHIGIIVDNVTLRDVGSSMTDYLGNAKDYHIAQKITTISLTGTPSGPTAKDCEMMLFAVSLTLLDVPSLQYVSHTSHYLPDPVIRHMNNISKLRFLRISGSVLPTNIAIRSPMLEELVFADNSPSRATKLVLQSPGLKRLEANVSKLEFGDSSSLDYISLANVQSVELPVVCNPKIVQLHSCSSAALVLCRASSLEELLVSYMDDVELRPESSVRVLYVQKSKNLSLVAHARRPLEVLVLSDVEFTLSQPDIHAKRVWLEFGSVNPVALFRINLQSTTHLGTYSVNSSYDHAIKKIRRRIGNSDFVTVCSTGSLENRRATKHAWMAMHGYESTLLTEYSFVLGR